MRKSRWPQCLGVGTTLLALALNTACSRRGGLEVGRENSPSRQQVPFHQAAASPAADGVADDPATPGHQAESDLPFYAPASVTLPAGTLLTVRLEAAISSGKPDAARTFAATLESPVMVDGTTVLRQGAAVRGRLECAHSSGLKPDAGYVCLTLDAIAVGGRTIPLDSPRARAPAVSPLMG